MLPSNGPWKTPARAPLLLDLATHMIPACSETGLPLGRWPATPSDLAAFAAMPDATHRRRLLDDWTTLTDAVRDAVGGNLPACWLSGSFFTTKERPGDIDCVYIVGRDDLVAARQDPDRARFLQGVTGHGARDNFGLLVDVYFLDWWPRPGTFRGSDDRRRGYLEDRGYWDDLWSRNKDGDAKTSRLPRRGYLEVILDGFR